jgi:Sulfatase-modifying factor enzyme 1
MGSRDTEKGRADHEAPPHEVTIAKPFAVAKFDVTFDEWDACATHGDCDPHISASDWGRGRQPAINVSWDDAQRYVAWLSRVTGKPYRLLTEAEWEYASRAGTTTAYYWGDEIGKGNANAVAAVASGTAYGRPRSAHLLPTRSGYTTWLATCTSGYRTAITATTKKRPQMVRRGRAEEIAVAVSFAAVPGSSFHSSSARPTATGTPPDSGRPTSGSVSGGRLPLESLPLYPLGPGRSPGRNFLRPCRR